MDIQLEYFGILLSLMCLAYGDGVTVVTIPNSVINNTNLRTDCHPDADSNQMACEARGCIWDSTVANLTVGIAACYVPKSKGGYSLSTQTTLTNNMGMVYTLNRASVNPITNGTGMNTNANSTGFSLFNNDVKQLTIMLTMSTANAIRMKITGKKRRFCTCNM